MPERGLVRFTDASLSLNSEPTQICRVVSLKDRCCRVHAASPQANRPAVLRVVRLRSDCPGRFNGRTLAAETKAAEAASKMVMGRATSRKRLAYWPFGLAA